MHGLRSLIAAAVIATAGCGLAACGGSSSGDLSSAANKAAASLSQIEADASGGAPTAQSSGADGSTSQINVRIANLYVTDANKPGPGLDVYDVKLDGQAATPILTDVPYGTFSAYVQPHVDPDLSGSSIELEALPTGEDPATDEADAQSVGTAIDDGSHPQLTFVLTGSPGDGGESIPLDNITSTTYVEKGDISGGSENVAGKNAGPVAPAPPAGEAQLLASDAALDIPDVSPNDFLLIDSACKAPLNGDTNEPGVPKIFAQSGSAPSSFALFPVAAGTHAVSVVTTTSNDLLTCAQLTAKQGATSVTTTAGQQTMVLVYGTSLTDLQLAIGPVAP